MHQALENLEGVAAIADDAMVYGNGGNDEEVCKHHDENLKALPQRCREKHIKINKDIIKFRQKELTYMGHIISAEGLEPDPKKVTAIKEMSAPKDINELK